MDHPRDLMERHEAPGALLLLGIGLALALFVGRGAPGALPAPQSLLLDVNASSPAQLQALPGFGPALVARVVAGRPWRDPARLRELLGPRTWSQAAPHLALDGRALMVAAIDSAGSPR